ncbi:MAG: DUF2069 domain-containing protein [Thiotrichales bacterium]
MGSRPGVAYAVTLAAVLGLFAVLLVWTIGWRAPDGLPRSIVLLVLLGPLLLPLHGLLRGKTYTFTWSSFLALWYFVLGVSDATVPATRWLGAAEIGLSLTWFSAALLYVRWHGRAQSL